MLRICVLNVTLLLDQKEGQQKLFSVENITHHQKYQVTKKGNL